MELKIIKNAQYHYLGWIPMFQYSVFSEFRVFFGSCKEKKIRISGATVVTVHRLRKPIRHHECKRRKFLMFCVIYETM